MSLFDKKIVLRVDERREPDRRARLEDSIRDLNHQRMIISLLKNVALVASDARNFDDAVNLTLKTFCIHTEWEMGHAYYVDFKADEDGSACPQLLPTNFWYMRQPQRFRHFKMATESLVLTDCSGLPGRVIASNAPAWVSNLANADPETYPRTEQALQAGITTSLAFPVFVGGKIVAVLEFFSTEPRDVNAEILEVAEHIGTLLGYLMERKWAEDALRDSEHRFRSIFESAADGIILTDSYGIIIAVNKSAEDLFGYTSSEIVGRPFVKLLPDRFRAMAQAQFNNSDRTNPTRILLRQEGLHKAGREFPIELSCSYWKTGKSSFYCYNVHDLTPTIQSETALKKSEEYYQSILNNSLDLIRLVDKQGTIIFCNASSARIVGYEADELVGHKLEDFMHPDDAKDALKVFYKVVNNPGQEGSMQYRFHHKDGYWCYLETVCKTIDPTSADNGIIVNSKNVTERAVRDQHIQLLASLVEASDDAIYAVDPDGIVLSWNHSAEVIYGWSKEDIEGKSINLIAPPDKVDEVASIISAVSSGRSVNHGIYERVCKDGSRVQISLSVSPICDGDELTGLACIARLME